MQTISLERKKNEEGSITCIQKWRELKFSFSTFGWFCFMSLIASNSSSKSSTSYATNLKFFIQTRTVSRLSPSFRLSLRSASCFKACSFSMVFLMPSTSSLKPPEQGGLVRDERSKPAGDRPRHSTRHLASKEAMLPDDAFLGANDAVERHWRPALQCAICNSSARWNLKVN